MVIARCALHSRYQLIAKLDTETGEVVTRRLEHGEPSRGGERFGTLIRFAGIRVQIAQGLCCRRRQELPDRFFSASCRVARHREPLGEAEFQHLARVVRGRREPGGSHLRVAGYTGK